MATIKLENIQKDFSNFIKPLAKQALNRAIPAIKRRIIDYFIEFKLVNSEKFKVLIGNASYYYSDYFDMFSPNELDVQAEFGTKQIKEVMDIVLGVLRSQLYIIPTSGPKSVGIRFKFIEADFSDVLKVPGASYYSNGHLIEWLKWILIEGSKTITDYYIDYNITWRERQKSRSGKALMKRIYDRAYAGDAWMVPEPFRFANIDSNFITDIFEETETQEVFARIMQEEFEKQFQAVLNG